MPIPWRNLAPHRPLQLKDAGDLELYAPRPDSPSHEVLRWLRSGSERPIALFGPTGCGKSTELARVARSLRTDPATMMVYLQLDRELVVRSGTNVSDIARAVLNRCVLTAAEEFHIALSDEMVGFARAMAEGPRVGSVAGTELLQMGLREIARKSERQVVLLLDGLEKLSVTMQRDLVRELVPVAPIVRLVVVVSVDLATGPDAAALIGEFRLVSVGPVVVDTDIDRTLAAQGIDFLLGITRRRLGESDLGPDCLTAMRWAATESGGVPRTYLQLLQDAAARASMRGEDVPNSGDVFEASIDQAEQVFRLLREGDISAIREVTGLTGTEMALARRLRLLAHGILLEYRTASGVRVYPVALLKPKLDQQAA